MSANAPDRARRKARPVDRVTLSPLAAALDIGIDGANGFLNARARGLGARLLPFYRRHPYEGPLGLFAVDPRGAWSPQDGFFYNRIPKAANSTVMAALARHSTFRKAFSRNRSKSRFLRPSRMSRADVAALDAAFCFTFVRDPYARVLSAFADKVLGKRQQARRFYRWLGRTEDAGFPDFLGYLEAGGLHDDPHWAPQADLLLLPVARFDFIGRVECLDADLATVVARIFGGVPGTAPFPQAGPRSDSRGRFASAYDPDTFARVTRLYARDFEAFGYATRTV